MISVKFLFAEYCALVSADLVNLLSMNGYTYKHREFIAPLVIQRRNVDHREGRCTYMF